MDTPVTPNTPFEDVDGPNDLIRNLVTVRLGNASCESSDRVPNIESKDKSMPYCVMNDYDHWVSGKVCAQIYVPCEEAYTEEIRIVDQFQRFSSVKVEPGLKYMFILIDGAIRVYITQEALKSTVSTYIGHSNITQDTGFTLSGVIELSQKVEHAIPFPKEDWNVLHETLVAVSTSYCRKLTTPEYALTLVDNDFVCRQLSFCGLLSSKILDKPASNVWSSGISELNLPSLRNTRTSHDQGEFHPYHGIMGKSRLRSAADRERYLGAQRARVLLPEGRDCSCG